MTREEAKTVFLNRGYIEVEGGTIYDADKWRQSVSVISKWLEQESCDDAISRKQVKSDYADWYGYGYEDNWFYRHLSNIPPVNPQPCEDAISRQAALGCCRNEWEEEVEIRLKSLPLVNPQPKTGHWRRVTDNAGYLVWECDKCGWQQRFNTNFCPDCGYRMVKPQESEEKG